MVADSETGEIFWSKALAEEVWEKGWLNQPTMILVLHLNFVNQMTGIILDTKLVILRSPQDLLSLEVDTNRLSWDE